MKKIVTLFVVLFATIAMWAQDYDFQVGDLYYRITRSEQPYTVEVASCNWDAEYVEIPTTVVGSIGTSNEEQPTLEAPGAGKVTICVRVPEPLCEGSFVVIPGSLTDWGTGKAVEKGQATKLVEGTQTWYAGTFDWGPDYAFKIAHCKPNGTWEWQYQAASGILIEGDITTYDDDITRDMIINSDNQVIYIAVDSWEMNACEKQNDAGTAVFNLTALNFPEEAQFAVAGSGLSAGAWACPPPAEHIMSALGDGEYILTLDVPAEFQYKYLVNLDGTGEYWEWFSVVNYNMPLDLITYDIEDYDTPWGINRKKESTAYTNDDDAITYTITSIGHYAFSDCFSLMDITIPSSVKTIEDDAFADCYSLLKTNYAGDLAGWCEIEFSNPTSNPMIHSGNLYINNQEVTNLVIPDGVETIQNHAFVFGINIVSASIPNSVTHIGEGAFSGCISLTSVSLPNSLMSIGDGAFTYCPSLTSLTIPEGVEYIGYEAFSDCASLTYLSIPNSVQYSYEEVYDYGYTEVYYLEGYTSIRGCYNLKTLIVPADFFAPEDDYYYDEIANYYLPYLPEQLESLTINGGDMNHRLGWDFIKRNRKQLKHIDFSATETIGEEAFRDLYQLESLILPSQLETVPYMAVAECVKLSSIAIPATVTEIEDRAFENCRMLSSVYFAENGALTSIGNWAFYNCHELTDIIIPEGVTEIGSAAFYGCTYLKELTLPSSLQSIADNAFALCAKLGQMNVDANTPPQVEARTFEDVNRSIPVYVPAESVDLYQTAEVWKEFNIRAKVPAGIEHMGVDNNGVQKIISNGQLIIIRDGKTYNAMGQELY